MPTPEERSEFRSTVGEYMVGFSRDRVKGLIALDEGSVEGK